MQTDMIQNNFFAILKLFCCSGDVIWSKFNFCFAKSQTFEKVSSPIVRVAVAIICDLILSYIFNPRSWLTPCLIRSLELDCLRSEWRSSWCDSDRCLGHVLVISRFVSDASVSTGAIALNCVIGAFCGKEAGQCTMSLVFATCMAMPEEDSLIAPDSSWKVLIVGGGQWWILDVADSSW